jgi:major membrane immunogen (membrane-anchored lipoprotein)
MLCFNGLGDETRANAHKERYLRFKADEASQAITGTYRQAHPEDNNERQLIHEHVSVSLDTGTPKKIATAYKGAAGRTKEETRAKTEAVTKTGGGSR